MTDHADATAVHAPQTPGPRAWRMYRSLVGTGLACGLLIVAVFELTRPIIQHNKIVARERAILAVLPTARSSTAFEWTDDGRFEPAPADRNDGQLVFAGYDDNGALVGLALEAQAMGYQDVVRVLYGYSFEREAIIGFQVLESRETPGLGTRIETDPAFLQNFEQLDVSLDDSRTALRHAIEFVKSGQKENAWEVDGITGATISSRAVADMLGASAAQWIPKLAGRLDDFRSDQGGSER